MASDPKTTSQIQYQCSYLTIQQWLTNPNQLSDTLPSDGAGTLAGPYLVVERGIWKYPQQASGGRFVIPATVGRPVRLCGIVANLGALASYTIWIAGFDATAGRPDNISGTPYAAADAALYREGAIQVFAETNVQYASHILDPCGHGIFALIHPGQHVYVLSNGGIAPRIRLTFSSLVE